MSEVREHDGTASNLELPNAHRHFGVEKMHPSIAILLANDDAILPQS